MNRRFVRALLGAVAVLGLLSSCPSPFHKSDLTAGFDENPPEIVLTRPLDGDSYGSALFVSGTVTDVAANGESGAVRSLRYSVASLLSLTEVTTVNDDGSFQFLVDCGDYSGSIVLEITADDWNGNERIVTVNLVDTASDIPSFALAPGNEKIEVTWDAVPGATSYTLYEYVSGFTVEFVADDAVDEYDFEYEGLSDEPLRNGSLVLLQLKADMDEGYDDAWSDTQTCVPLSPFTLMPFTRSGYGTVQVEWYNSPAVDRYTVLRSTSRDGTYLVHRIVNGNAFTDRDVVVGQTYFYRVQPNGQDEIPSGIAAGTPHSIATKGLHVASIVPSPTFGAQASAVLGTTLYSFDRVGGGSYGTAGVYAYDMSDPTAPVLLGSDTGIDVGWETMHAEISSDGYIFVQTKDSDNEYGIAVINASNGGENVEIANELLTYQGDSTTDTGEYSFATAGDVFYFGDQGYVDRFFGIAAADAADATQVGDFETGATWYLDTSGTFSSLDWDAPRVMATDTIGGIEYLFMGDGHADVNADNPPTQDEGIQLFYFPLEADDHFPAITGSAQVTGSVVASALTASPQAWPTAPTGEQYNPEYMDAADGWLVVTARLSGTADDEDFYGLAVYRTVETNDPQAFAVPTYSSGTTISASIGPPAIDGNRLVVPFEREQAIKVYSLPDLELVQTIPAPSANPHAVTVSGTYYYVSGDYPGTFVLDTAGVSPSFERDFAPAQVTSVGTVMIDGGRAYLMNTASELQILDLSNGPTAPVMCSTLDLDLVDPAFVWISAVYAFDTLAAVCSADGLTLIDVEDPYSPRVLSTILANQSPLSVTRYGDIFYVGCQTGSIVGVDISDPADPVIVGSIAVPGQPDFPSRNDTTILYPVSSQQVVAIDVSSPFDFSELDSIEVLSPFEGAFPISSSTVGEYFYTGCMANDVSYIAVVDARSPDSLSDVTDTSAPATMDVTSPLWDDGGDQRNAGGFVPITMRRITDELLLGLTYWVPNFSFGPGDYGDNVGAHLLSVSVPEHPSEVTGFAGVSPLTYGADWFGNWGYLADQEHGLTYVNLGD